MTRTQNNIQRGVPKIPPTHTLFFSDNKKEKTHAWGEFFFHPPEQITIEQGLDYMLEHFSGQLWPRMVSTAATRKGQREVDGKDRAMLYYEGALGEDCRIAAYGIGQTNPDLLFIELDAADFASKRAFKLALTTTLKNIKREIGGHPTVLWSGRGCHIIQPIYCPKPLEEIEKDLALLEPHTSNKFLQFAERHLSAGRCDKGHHPAIRSCMLRIPGSINSKCKELGLAPEVKIIKRWNKYRPDYRLLMGDFHADLVGKQQHRHHGVSSLPVKCSNNSATLGITIPWIEKLLQTPIRDYRKHTVALILAPYLLTIKGMLWEQAYNTIGQWLARCNKIRRLEPASSQYMQTIVEPAIDRTIQKGARPMRWVTLHDRNPGLCEELLSLKEPNEI